MWSSARLRSSTFTVFSPKPERPVVGVRVDEPEHLVVPEPAGSCYSWLF